MVQQSHLQISSVTYHSHDALNFVVPEPWDICAFRIPELCAASKFIVLSQLPLIQFLFFIITNFFVHSRLRGCISNLKHVCFRVAILMKISTLVIITNEPLLGQMSSWLFFPAANVCLHLSSRIQFTGCLSSVSYLYILARDMDNLFSC